MQRDLAKSEQIQYRYILSYLILIVITWAYTIITYKCEKHTLTFYCACIELSIDMYALFIVLLSPYSTIRKLLSLYIITISVLTLPNLILYRMLGSYEIYLWYLSALISLYVMYPGKKFVFWCGFIFLQIVSSFFIPGLLKLINISPDRILGQYPLFIFSDNYEWGIFTVFFLLYLSFFHIIKYYEAKKEEIIGEKGKSLPEISDSSQKRYTELYECILHYFEKEKPYTDPNYTINQLAIDLNSNTSYIAKAIKTNRNMNFNMFVNTYRIKRVKTLMAQEDGNKFTLQYMYSLAGFKSQATFNRVFKQIEGITPSECFQKKN